MDDTFDEIMRIQRNTATRLRREDELDRKITLMAIIQGLVPDKKGRILTEQIMVESAAHEITDADTERLVDDLEEDGFLKRVEQGIMMLM